jgi:hypothetical protein
MLPMLMMGMMGKQQNGEQQGANGATSSPAKTENSTTQPTPTPTPASQANESNTNTASVASVNSQGDSKAATEKVSAGEVKAPGELFPPIELKM